MRLFSLPLNWIQLICNLFFFRWRRARRSRSRALSQRMALQSSLSMVLILHHSPTILRVGGVSYEIPRLHRFLKDHTLLQNPHLSRILLQESLLSSKLCGGNHLIYSISFAVIYILDYIAPRSEKPILTSSVSCFLKVCADCKKFVCAGISNLSRPESWILVCGLRWCLYIKV